VHHRVGSWIDSLIASRRNSSGYGGLVLGTRTSLSPAYDRKRSSVVQTGATPVVERTLPLALPLIEEAAGSPVKGLIGNSDPVRAVSDAIGAGHLEEVIVSTLP